MSSSVSELFTIITAEIIAERTIRARRVQRGEFYMGADVAISAKL